MTLLELWEQAKKEDATMLWLLIEFLVFEKAKESKLTFQSSAKELEFYYQDRFRDKMNTYLREYMQKRGIVTTPYNQEEHLKNLEELERVNELIHLFEIVQQERQREYSYQGVTA